MASYFRARRESKRFGSLKPSEKRIVFYAEDAASWPHLEPILMNLIRKHDQKVCYLSSQADDPVFGMDEKNLEVFFIGEGTVRTLLFKMLDCGILVMTMPDLETFHIKRSVNPVHYIYVHHSMVSTHMVYRKGVFDHFDTIFCVGPHHVEETRETEKLHGLPAKTLVEFGYSRLDTIIQSTDRSEPGISGDGGSARVLLAPSWGSAGILETMGEELVEVLTRAGHHVTVRPHPMTRRKASAKLEALKGRFGGNPLFTYEENIASTKSLIESQIMISDWSGAALEYAFGLERPVLFIDVPKKVNNSDFERHKSIPLEVFIREELGAVLAPDKIAEAPQVISGILADVDGIAARAREAREKWVYNLGQSGEIGARHIVELAAKLSD